MWGFCLRLRRCIAADGEQLVEYFGRLNGLNETTLKKRIDEIFARLDMNGFRDRRCDKLSTGMKQKTSMRGRWCMTRR